MPRSKSSEVDVESYVPYNGTFKWLIKSFHGESNPDTRQQTHKWTHAHYVITNLRRCIQIFKLIELKL